MVASVVVAGGYILGQMVASLTVPFVLPFAGGWRGTLIAWAKQLGHNDVVSLNQTLDEEKATDRKLTTLAESRINLRAAS